MEKIKPIPLITGTWLCLFFLFLPFPMDILPEIGSYLTTIFLPISEALSNTNPEILSSTFSFSDSIHLYLQTSLLGLASLIVVLTLARLNKAQNLLPWIKIAISYILAFFLLKYGLEKWTRLQFPAPPPNILHASTGSLDKDILFWSLMGTSKFYAGFMGLVEVLAGTLLFFRKTRFIGGYMVLGVFMNVVAINIGFDITVKLLSFALLFSALFIIAPTLQPIFQLLSGAEIKPIQTQELSIKPVFKRALKGFVTTLILLECGLPMFQRDLPEFNPETLQYQTFNIIQSINTPKIMKGDDYRQLHFHPNGYLIAETYEGNFESYAIQLPKGANAFTFSKNDYRIKAIKKDKEWLFVKGEKLLWRCRRVPNEELPLLQDKFHWTVEGMIPK